MGKLQITQKQIEALELQKQGLTYWEIADELGISEGSVNKRLQRARHHINGTKAPNKSKAGKKLSPKEAEVLDLKLQGFTHAQIAEKMHITITTVKNHMNGIRKKGVTVARYIQAK
jgi:DNA-binding CsgD family transcriptional regulator